MTMLSPLGRVPKRRPVRKRGSHRPLPLITFTILFALLAGAIWYKAFTGSQSENRASATCATSGDNSEITPSSVTLRVYNASGKDGLASETADQLRARGFDVEITANDPLTGRETSPIAEIRYGQAGERYAHILHFHAPDAELKEDPRTGPVIDLALGPKFSTLEDEKIAQQGLESSDVLTKAC